MHIVPLGAKEGTTGGATKARGVVKLTLFGSEAREGGGKRGGKGMARRGARWASARFK
jgi:hypothetical protein